MRTLKQNEVNLVSGGADFELQQYVAPGFWGWVGSYLTGITYSLSSNNGPILVEEYARGGIRG